MPSLDYNLTYSAYGGPGEYEEWRETRQVVAYTAPVVNSFRLAYDEPNSGSLRPRLSFRTRVLAFYAIEPIVRKKVGGRWQIVKRLPVEYGGIRPRGGNLYALNTFGKAMRLPASARAAACGGGSTQLALTASVRLGGKANKRKKPLYKKTIVVKKLTC